MKGFFSIGVDSISKSQNLGNLFRSANAFGASYVFTLNSAISFEKMDKVDTSKSYRNLPLYNFSSFGDMPIPHKTELVAVELLDDSENLPNFYHPKQAIYILGPEKGCISDEVLEQCHHRVKIPTQFCINVAMAGALVMYDRIASMNGGTIRRPKVFDSSSFDEYEVKAPNDYID